MKKICYYLYFSIFLISCESTENKIEEQVINQASVFKTELLHNWFLSNSKMVSNGGILSKNGIDKDNWVGTKVPSTVLASLVNAGIYTDVYSGMNMKNIPTDQFKNSWLYFKSFDWEKSDNEYVVLDLKGINYKANIWLNGKIIADTSSVFGVYKKYELDVTDQLKKENKLVIEVFPPVPGDFTIGFVDWAPVPPDNNMGIWRGVSLVKSLGVSLTETYVQTDFDVNNPKSANIIISTLLKNTSRKVKEITLEGEIGELNFIYKVTLNPYEERTINLSPDNVKGLTILNPKLWWPHTMGNPNLYQLKLRVRENMVITSAEEVMFGIRKIEDFINGNGHRGYKINGHAILIKGAGWVDDLMLDNDSSYDKSQISYVKQMNFNTIRFEGFWGKNEAIYSRCDREGILMMVGFSCQWEWSDYLGGKKFNEDEDGFGGVLGKEEIKLVTHYFKDQVKWLRNHPSIFVYTVGSDRLPHPDLEAQELAILDEYSPSALMLSSAKLKTSVHTGSSAVKMEGPYDYVTPNYWYTDTIRGGAFGFNTETGPGPQPPVIYSVRKMIPNKDERWPLDNAQWKYHSGRHEFGDMSKFLTAFNSRYGESSSIEDFSKYAQVATYEAMRPMYEAFEVNRPNATGIIQWMLNSAWPETYWQLYDSYLHPTGAFYGAKHGCRNVNPIYNYGDQKIYVSNESLLKVTGLLKITLLDSLSNVFYSLDLPIKMNGGEVLLVEDVKSHLPQSITSYFVDLRLTINGSEEVIDNFYWMSTEEDVIDPDYNNSSWVYTPNLSFTDLTFIRRLPKAKVSANYFFEESEGLIIGTVRLKNNSNVISFFNELTLVDETGDPILPVDWSDNYISLLPLEERLIEIRVSQSLVQGRTPRIVFNTINSEIE